MTDNERRAFVYFIPEKVAPETKTRIEEMADTFRQQGYRVEWYAEAAEHYGKPLLDRPVAQQVDRLLRGGDLVLTDSQAGFVRSADYCLPKDPFAGWRDRHVLVQTLDEFGDAPSLEAIRQALGRVFHALFGAQGTWAGKGHGDGESLHGQNPENGNGHSDCLPGV